MYSIPLGKSSLNGNGSPSSQALSKNEILLIAIIGFGTFGQFLAKRLLSGGHKVLASSKKDYTEIATNMGVKFLSDIHDLCELHPDVIVLATSILSTRSVIRSIPFERLKRSTLVVDVLSVKVYPKQLLLDEIPKELDILCTHPMFGPDSGAGSWDGLNFMYEKVRLRNSEERKRRLDLFLKFFANEGCRMVEMTCEEHDRHAASTQFITHTIGRMLAIDTNGYKSLLNLVENTTHDSFELYYGLFLYNTNATEVLNKVESAFFKVRQELLSNLYSVMQSTLMGDSATAITPINVLPESSSK